MCTGWIRKKRSHRSMNLLFYFLGKPVTYMSNFTIVQVMKYKYPREEKGRKKKGEKKIISAGHGFALRHSSDLLAFKSVVCAYLPRTGDNTVLSPQFTSIASSLYCALLERKHYELQDTLWVTSEHQTFASHSSALTFNTFTMFLMVFSVFSFCFSGWYLIYGNKRITAGSNHQTVVFKCLPTTLFLSSTLFSLGDLLHV